MCSRRTAVLADNLDVTGQSAVVRCFSNRLTIGLDVLQADGRVRSLTSLPLSCIVVAPAVLLLLTMQRHHAARIDRASGLLLLTSVRQRGADDY